MKDSFSYSTPMLQVALPSDLRKGGSLNDFKKAGAPKVVEPATNPEFYFNLEV